MTGNHEHSANIEHWLRLIRADGIGPTLFKRLEDYFGDVERILGASVAQLTKVEGIGHKNSRTHCPFPR